MWNKLKLLDNIDLMFECFTSAQKEKGRIKELSEKKMIGGGWKGIRE